MGLKAALTQPSSNVMPVDMQADIARRNSNLSPDVAHKASVWIRDDAPGDTVEARLSKIEDALKVMRDVLVVAPTFTQPTAAPAPVVPVTVTHDSSGFKYNWKPRNEILFGLAVAVSPVILSAFADFENIKDWRIWLMGLVAGCVRAVIGLLLPKAPAELSVPISTLPSGTSVQVEGAARPFTTNTQSRVVQ